MPNDVGTMNAVWTAPDGVEWNLSDISPDRGYFTTDKVGGWGARPYELVTDPQPRGGERVRFVRAQPARLTWPLHIWGTTHQEFVTRYRALRKAFMSTVHRGQVGVLRVARPDGTSREIQAFYEDGFGGEPGQNWVSANPVLTLFCPEGAWSDPEHTEVSRSPSAQVPFNDPFLSISPSQILGTTTITNPGDLTAWPTWTITGPASSISATNNTAEHTFTINYTLLAGETMTVVTAGPQPGVRGPADQNLSGELNWPEAYLWGLEPGDNEVEFIVGGSSGTTNITLTFHALYEGA